MNDEELREVLARQYARDVQAQDTRASLDFRAGWESARMHSAEIELRRMLDQVMRERDALREEIELLKRANK